MKVFLQELAEKVYLDHGNDLEGVTIVFPNRRAGLFFRKYLAENLEKPVWSPAIMSLEDFVKPLSAIQPLDKLSLVFKLYSIYKKISPRKEEFDRFFYWGEMLLKDFDDIDKYLVNAKNLYVNLSRLKELDQVFDYLTVEQKKIIREFWHNFDDRPSEEKENFLRIWEILFDLYDQFTRQLKDESVGYMGMIYRDVVDKINENALKTNHNKVIFAGFNALTKSEEKIISWFLEEGKAEVYWDVDAYYVNDENQEAGMFFREYGKKSVFAKSFPYPLPDHFKQPENKNITITGVSMSVGQAKVLGQHLREAFNDPKQYENSVIILPEEHMLFPVLHSLPEDITKINVTMGFPLRNTPLYSLFEHLLEMQINLRQSSSGEVYFPYRQVLAILKHPYVRNFDLPLAERNIIDIEKNNKIFIELTTLEFDRVLYPLVFKTLEKGNEIFTYLLDILMVINSEQRESDGHALEREYIYQFFTQLKRLQEITREQRIALALNAFLRLFRQMVQSLRLPFSGEPLRGLQIMGVLESRNLDFENVFILSMNEGAFPAATNQHSFIPYNLRRAFELPTYDHLDAIYAYLFYRLLQKAKNVHLYYNTQSGINTGGEMSRFLQQLLFETDFKIKNYVLNNGVKLPVPEAITITKSDTVEKELRRFMTSQPEFSHRFTPSAVNTYLDCRLKFYLRHIARIREPEKLEDEVDPKVFGNLLHNTMEFLYKRFIETRHKTSVTTEDFDFLNTALEEAIVAAFRKQYQIPRHKKFSFEGRNILAKAMVRKFAGKILENDRQYAPFEIIGLEADEEEGYHTDLPVVIRGKQHFVGLKGVIDRIDNKEGVVRVIDYKTGRDDKRIEDIPSLFDRHHEKRNKAAMQTLFYSLLFTEARPGNNLPVMPGIFNSKEMFADEFDIRLKVKEPGSKNKYLSLNDARPVLAAFRQGLTGILEEIFDVENNFDQTEDLKVCVTCPYTGICHR